MTIEFIPTNRHCVHCAYATKRQANRKPFISCELLNALKMCRTDWCRSTLRRKISLHLEIVPFFSLFLISKIIESVMISGANSMLLNWIVCPCPIGWPSRRFNGFHEWINNRSKNICVFHRTNVHYFVFSACRTFEPKK